MNPILEIQGLSKKYTIRHHAADYLSLREQILNIFRFNESRSEDFWALQDVSFDVAPGESIGIIGRNGAGKSTLLKVLSKITRPTLGKVVMRGRTASLLEVGTGFHPELTGRENVFLNGSLLGMKRREIQARFDEIVDFSGIEKFLDTPLKHYSSGMQVRLAFSVAAFLEPEILVVDEVLAVGDAEFQRKCLGKMEDVGQSGRTILFVSHDLDAVERLCKTSILLSEGKVAARGPSGEVISKYVSEAGKDKFLETELVPGVSLKELAFPERTVLSGQSLPFSLRLGKTPGRSFGMTDLCLLFYNYKKQRVAIFDMRDFFRSFDNGKEEMTYSGTIQHFNLIEGDYNVGLFYGFEGLHGDAYDLVRIKVRRDQSHEAVKPYDVQYRGYVELR